MSRRKLHDLLTKYLEGNCSDSEKTLIDGWLSILDRDEYWNTIDKEELPVIEQHIWQRLTNSIEAETTTIPAIISPQRKYRIPVWVRAAAIIGLLATGVAVFYNGYYRSGNAIDQKVSSQNWQEKVNNTAEMVSFQLEDGTLVKLAPSSSIYYPFHFEIAKREIRLNGTAFFDVAKDKNRIFYVYADKIVTQVLGTSFWVRENSSSDNSEVEVCTGRVSVYNAGDENSIIPSRKVILKPNEKVIFYDDKKQFLMSLADNPIPLAASDSLMVNKFIFEEAPVSKVLTVLEKEYGISIVTETAEMNEWLFTGDLSDTDFFTKLTLICQSTQATYEVQENVVLLKRQKK